MERNYFSSCTFTQTANSPVDENFPSIKTLWRKLTSAHLSGNSLATVFTVTVLLTFSLKGSRLWCRTTLDRPELVQLEMVSAWFELRIFKKKKKKSSWFASQFTSIVEHWLTTKRNKNEGGVERETVGYQICRLICNWGGYETASLTSHHHYGDAFKPKWQWRYNSIVLAKNDDKNKCIWHPASRLWIT